MVIVDVLVRAIGGLLVIVNRIFPSFPPAVQALVTSISNSIGAISLYIPYGHLLPWPVVTAALAGTPLIYGFAIVVRGIMSAIALVRSRGISAS